MVLWSHNAALADEDGRLSINSRETVEALKYAKALQETFISGNLSWQDPSNKKAFLAEQISLTQNGVSIYFVAKNDPKSAPIAADMDHAPMPAGLAKSTPQTALVINTMAFKHTRYPNAAKEYIRSMMEAERYEPWLNACLGYWSHPLKAYDAAAVWSGDPKVRIFREACDHEFWTGYKGPVSAASAAVAATGKALLQGLSWPRSGAEMAELQVSGVLETSLYVADLERSRAFYTRVFAFETFLHDCRICALGVPGRHVLLLFRHGGSVRPSPTPGGTVPAHDGTGRLHLCFSIPTDELAAWETHLTRHGIAVESRVSWPHGGTSLYFRDPDEHSLEVATPGLWPNY